MKQVTLTDRLTLERISKYRVSADCFNTKNCAFGPHIIQYDSGGKVTVFVGIIIGHCEKEFI